jgi:hypothetical protein
LPRCPAVTNHCRRRARRLPPAGAGIQAARHFLNVKQPGGCSCTFSRRVASEWCEDHTLENRGKAGCPAAPAASRAKVEKHTSVVSTGSDGFNRLSPRDGFNVYFALSPVTGLFCHRRFADHHPQSLAPASGRQDHTTSPSAWMLFVDSTFASIASRTQRS